MSDVVTHPGWVPIRIYWRDGQAMVDWCDLGDMRYAEPFFEQTIARCLRHPFNLLFRHQTPIEILEGFEAAAPCLRPNGFIFHMSRCGSTLLAQMLAAAPQNCVISEAAPIDEVLRADPALPDERRIRRLRGVIAALGRRRTDEARYLFIKFDSWSVFDLPLIRRAFPEVPLIFLYRDPVEVMVSHRRNRGSQMVPGAIAPHALGLSAAQVARMSLDEYCAHVLAQICGAAARQIEGAGLAVSYRQLPHALFSPLLDFFGAAYPPDALGLMESAALRDAKNPSFQFADDTQEKRREATPALRELADRLVRPAYERLEAINRRQFPRAEEWERGAVRA